MQSMGCIAAAAIGSPDPPHPTFAVGGAALRGGQLRALNQSVSTQVAMLMQVRSVVARPAPLPQQPRNKARLHTHAA